jgi:nicotinamide-nucleotide amidase
MKIASGKGQTPMDAIKDLALAEPRLSLAIAESVTCGRVQAKIGEISGASEFFLGGITAYTLEQKVRLLGIDRAAAATINSVSAEVAEQMARGACDLFKADIGVATTGYAEAAQDWSVSEPFAWWAIAHRQKTGAFALRSSRVNCPGAPRVETQAMIATAALTALIEFLRELRAK